MKTSRTVTGHINVVQEERFRLMLDDGRNFLFTLGHGAGVDQPGLERLKKSGAHLRVEYSGEPDEVSGVAERVEVVGAGGGI